MLPNGIIVDLTSDCPIQGPVHSAPEAGPESWGDSQALMACSTRVLPKGQAIVSTCLQSFPPPCLGPHTDCVPQWAMAWGSPKPGGTPWSPIPGWPPDLPSRFLTPRGPPSSGPAQVLRCFRVISPGLARASLPSCHHASGSAHLIQTASLLFLI